MITVVALPYYRLHVVPAVVALAFSEVRAAVGADAGDEALLDAPGWSAVVTAAARLAQVLVANDQSALSKLHDAGHRWPLGSEPSSAPRVKERIARATR
ncbi:hypothetical protein ACQKM2_07675 [Streptomyces sp. NPDC004126]|uniref:hypothetical protein n=1 Tax=Streptomyces sp. NPDC004126 TaxID=3390695 RepID=UPI003D04EDB3